MISRNFELGNLNLDDKSILITGGTGSFGQAIVKKLLLESSAERIIIYSRDEQKQFYMAQKYNTKNFPNI